MFANDKTKLKETCANIWPIPNIDHCTYNDTDRCISNENMLQILFNVKNVLKNEKRWKERERSKKR